MDNNYAAALMAAQSIKVFCDGDKTYVYGEWKAWRAACSNAGKKLPPIDFKKPFVMANVAINLPP